jgi:3-oxoacyl-[acyl-carrier protein] reductase
MANRLSQVSGHISNAHGRGLLAGEVAIITGMCAQTILQLRMLER